MNKPQRMQLLKSGITNKQIKGLKEVKLRRHIDPQPDQKRLQFGKYLFNHNWIRR